MENVLEFTIWLYYCSTHFDFFIHLFIPSIYLIYLFIYFIHLSYFLKCSALLQVHGIHILLTSDHPALRFISPKVLLLLLILKEISFLCLSWQTNIKCNLIILLQTICSVFADNW